MQPSRTRMLAGIILTVLLIFSTLILFSPIFLHQFGITEVSPPIFFYSRLGIWFSVLLIWTYSRTIEKQNMLLWKEKEYEWWVYPVSLIAILFAIVIGLFVTNIVLIMFRFHKDTQMLYKLVELLRPNKWLLLFSLFTAGFTEEVLFRGYIQPRLELLFRNSILSIVVTSVLFGAIHFGYKSIYQVVGPITIGVIFSIYYWKFRNIKVLIIAHFVWDLLSFLFLFLIRK